MASRSTPMGRGNQGLLGFKGWSWGLGLGASEMNTVLPITKRERESERRCWRASWYCNLNLIRSFLAFLAWADVELLMLCCWFRCDAAVGSVCVLPNSHWIMERSTAVWVEIQIVWLWLWLMCGCVVPQPGPARLLASASTVPPLYLTGFGSGTKSRGWR